MFCFLKNVSMFWKILLGVSGKFVQKIIFFEQIFTFLLKERM